MPVEAYVQDGLVAHFDAICNATNAAGKLVHSTDGSTWIDIVSRTAVPVATTDIPTVGDDHYALTGHQRFERVVSGFCQAVANSGFSTIEYTSQYTSLSSLGVCVFTGNIGFYYQSGYLTFTQSTGQCGNWQSVGANTYVSSTVVHPTSCEISGVLTYLNGALSTGNRNVTWSAAYKRSDTFSVGNHSSSSHTAVGKIRWIDAAKIVDLTGKADWTVPAGRWTVLRLGSANAKYVNAPAPKEATGWECDKLDPAGIEANFRGYIGRLTAGPLKNRISGFLVDSWECFGQTWTPKMERYFADANGYPLRMWLPALFGWVVGSPERTEAFLTDWRRTNGDLITKNYYGRMAELAHAAGLSVLYETAFGDIIHGDLLEYWKYADAPMCEFWFPHVSRDEAFVGSYAFKPIRPCASAAHIYAKPRVIAEAFTEWGISWKEDLRSLRDDANRHFARGVTHLAFQSYTHAPNPKSLPPGGCMGGYNGTPFTRLQTWWKHMPEFTRWLRECEERLESGRPAEDVLWYLGDAVDHKPDENFAFPEGFRADYLNHDVLVNRLSVKEGKFAIPEGTTWRILWVPDTRFMRPATKAKLAELAAAGGTVVYGDKRVLQKALARLERDVATEPALGDEPSEDFMWIHRTEGSVERYFVAAGTNGFGGKVTFRAKGPVSIYDPVSRLHSAWTNGTPLRLARSQSVFVEFGVAAKETTSAVHLLSPPAFSAPWKLSFTPGWDAPASVTLDRLVPWCEIPGFSPAARAYSGTVAYETNFNLDLGLPLDHLALDLGRVEDVAVVYVNGKEVRTLWCEPYTCDISRFVRKGRNDLRIEVTGTWHNRVFYDQTLPEGERKTWALLHQPPRKDVCSTFIPQGLLGPVIKMVTLGACLAGPDARGVRNAIATSSAERALVRQLGPCRVVREGGRTVDDLVFRGNKVNRNTHYTGWGQPAFGLGSGSVRGRDRARPSHPCLAVLQLPLEK